MKCLVDVTHFLADVTQLPGDDNHGFPMHVLQVNCHPTPRPPLHHCHFISHLHGADDPYNPNLLVRQSCASQHAFSIAIGTLRLSSRHHWTVFQGQQTSLHCNYCASLQHYNTVFKRVTIHCLGRLTNLKSHCLLAVCSLQSAFPPERGRELLLPQHGGINRVFPSITQPCFLHQVFTSVCISMAHPMSTFSPDRGEDSHFF